MSKIKILILNEPERKNGVTWWRMYEPMRALEALYGDQIEIIWNRGVILPADLMRAHVAIAWRPSTAAQLAAIATVHQEGIPIIMDYDDDFNLPTGHPAYNDSLNDRPNIPKILSMAAMVWASTPRLAEVYGHNAVVVPNAIYPEMIAPAPNPITKTVVWAGDFLHGEDVWNQMSTYESILRRCERFVWIGYMPTYDHPKGKVGYTPFLSVDGYFQFLRQIKPNFIWKPMRKFVPFNWGKSNISKLVATMSGAVCATNYADKDGFENCLPEVTWKESVIHGVWEAARDEIRTVYNLEAWTHRRYQHIHDVANGATPARQPKENGASLKNTPW